MTTFSIVVKKSDLDENKHVGYAKFLEWYKKAHFNHYKKKNLDMKKIEKKYNAKFVARKIISHYLSQVILGDELTAFCYVKVGITSLKWKNYILETIR